jgi:hypothetical protein
MVNRIWAHHFGVGLVPTPENFGRSGASPTNRALLDWLACTFSATSASHAGRMGEWENGRMGERGAASLGWSLKQLHRLIVTSTAYRQSSAPPNPQSAIFTPRTGGRNPQSKDPDDRLLWRQRPRRLEAEAVRDGMLAVTGTLDTRMFGEPVPTEARPTGEVVPAGEEKGGRRSVYLLARRSLPVTFLNAFDAPIIETNCTRRMVSTTATQALALMNSSFLQSQGGHFARRLLREAPAAGPDTVLDRAFALAFSRPPTAAERASALAFLADQARRYAAAPSPSPEAAREKALADFCQALLSADEFVYVD